MTGWPASLRPRPPRKPAGTAVQGLGATSRIDDWWWSALVASRFTRVHRLYSVFSALLWKPLFGTAYEVDGYTSPFFVPFFKDATLPFGISPAILTLWIPIGFRVTCYYFRGAYYRAYLADPPACAVGEPTIHRRYRLETAFPFILQNLHRFFLYLAFVLLSFLWLEVLLSDRRRRRAARPGDAGPADRRRPADGLLAVLPLAPPSRRWAHRLLLVQPADQTRYGFGGGWGDLDERLPHALGLGEPRLGRGRRPVHPPARPRGPDRPGDPLLAAGRNRPRMADQFETHVHDVLVIGAGGAGLRAAIEAKTAGADVGLVCKSLLGKAHTVMAEGGVAAALGNVAAADSWQVHFRDTMVGGKLLNNPRMAELHATEAPDRVRELELWGAVFDRTPGRSDPAAPVRRAHPRASPTSATGPASR